MVQNSGGLCWVALALPVTWSRTCQSRASLALPVPRPLSRPRPSPAQADVIDPS